jgi:hypothetical protein
MSLFNLLLTNEHRNNQTTPDSKHKRRVHNHVRGTIDFKVNQRYGQSPFDDELDQKMSPMRFSLATRAELGIDRVRESNPFLDLSHDKAHVVFNKLFKHADENRRHSKPPTVVKNTGQLIKSMSIQKIEHNLKNIDKIMQLADSALKSSKKTPKDVNSTDARTGLLTKEPSVSFKNQNELRMNELTL